MAQARRCPHLPHVQSKPEVDRSPFSTMFFPLLPSTIPITLKRYPTPSIIHHEHERRAARWKSGICPIHVIPTTQALIRSNTRRKMGRRVRSKNVQQLASKAKAVHSETARCARGEPRRRIGDHTRYTHEKWHDASESYRECQEVGRGEADRCGTLLTSSSTSVNLPNVNGIGIEGEVR